MQKANLNNPPLDGQETYNAPPSYDQATGSSVGQPLPRSTPYPQPPPGFIPAENYPHVQQQQQQQQQQQPLYQSSYPQHMHQQPPPTSRQPPQVVIIQNHTLPLGPRASYITCPFCHIQKLTRVEPEPGSKTHLMAALLCVFGFWCCVCLPYCIDSCMNVNHYCGNCNKFLGTYNSGNM